MYLIRKKFEIDAGHRLMRNKYKCWNLHGHRYVIEVELSAESLDKNEMVLDFFELKWFKHWLDKKWDHGLILNEHDTDTVDFCKKQGFKIYLLPADPTAEGMAYHLHQILCGELKQQCIDVCVDRVIVHETPNCVAEYRDTEIKIQPH